MGYENINFEKNSVFLITGGAGFIGSNLCEVLLDKGYKVRCLDDLSNGKQANVDLFIDNPNYTFIKGDIRNLDTCLKACEGVDYVLNQAAWGSVPRSIEMPLLKACKAPSEVAGEAFNIAYGGREYLIDVYNSLCKALGKEIEPIFGPDRKVI